MPEVAQEAREACDLIARETGKICASGACIFGRYGCCSKAYCEAVRSPLVKHEISFEYDDEAELPYMGDDGCRVPAHFRPVCALYVCDRVEYSLFADRVTLEADQAEWDEATQRAMADPLVHELFDAVKDVIGMATIRDDWAPVEIPLAIPDTIRAPACRHHRAH